MATQVKLNGQVLSVTRSGNVRSARVLFPGPPAEEIVFDCTVADYDDFRQGIPASGGKKFDVTYDDTTNVPSTVTTHA